MLKAKMIALYLIVSATSLGLGLSNHVHAKDNKSTSRQTPNNSFSDKIVSGSGNVVGGSTTSSGSGAATMKTKHDTVKNTISNVR